MLDYNIANPVDPPWVRSKKSLVKEWRFHNWAYARGYKRVRTADTDFDNADEGKGFFGFLLK